MSNPSNYTIGWICAVGVELVAAQAFLDEKHDAPANIPVNDNNTYTLGSISNHNIVIAALPHWQYGLVTAATVARDLIRSFPNVRLGLMVGIGGGAPSSRHDIRLGDIVVSSPSHRSGGVLQYDYGKTIQNQSFSLTGFLNQPPQLLLTSIAVLEAQYEIDGHTLEQAINNVLEKKTRLRLKYQRPDASTDRLYQSSYTHRGSDKDSCIAACEDTESCLVFRTERSDDQDNPAIHYGLIASANQLMKDALIRDRLSAEKDILCFEMEAAGLMNHFPCLVIRGVCDYADTHKNGSWQGYAAMAAAAYVKDLLGMIAPNKIETERKLSEILGGVSQQIGDVHSLAVKMNKGIGALQEDSHIKQVMAWLSPPDPSINFNKALKQRQQGSGQWLIQHDKYTAWKNQPGSFLWLYGIPGCGKTIISSTIIENLGQSTPSSTSLFYHYFDFNDVRKQQFGRMVRSLIGQMYHKEPTLQGLLNSLYASCESGRREPTDDELRETFQSMIRQAGEVWIVLDALDECERREENTDLGLLSWIENLHNYQNNMHLLVTSRPEQDIKQAIETQISSDDMISIQGSLIERDLGHYIRARVRGNGRLRRWQSKPNVQNEIEATLLKKADGMFRWVSCQLDDLETCLDYPAVRRALASLPKTLNDTYTRILNNIPREHKPHTTRILQLLTYSERPLTIDEAVDALAVEIDTRRFDPENRMPDPTEISRYCSSLVVTVTEESYHEACDGKKRVAQLQLAHFSVKEYLTSNRLPENMSKDFNDITPRAAIVQTSLAYLLGINHGLLVAQIKQNFPFASYAAQYWASQAVMTEKCSEETQRLIAEFFQCTSAYECCYRLYPLDQLWEPGSDSGENTRCPSVLYYISVAGLVHSCRMQLDKGADVNAQEGEYGNSLYAASVRGHIEIVRMLLESGADLDTCKGFYSNPLQSASDRGYVEIVKILLENGADVNAQGGVYGNALYAASSKGYLGIVKMLLDKGADVNAQGGWYGNALYAASAKGYLGIVKMLLDKGADVNAQGGYGNALQASLANSHRNPKKAQAVIQMLLHKGAVVQGKVEFVHKESKRPITAKDEFRRFQEHLHRHTITWALDTWAHDAGAHGNIPQTTAVETWLRGGCDVLWDFGNLSSGKSTLMRRVGQEPSATELVSQWTPPQPGFSVGHYFRSGGTPMQWPLRGLLQPFLNEIVVSCPGVRMATTPSSKGTASKAASRTATGIRTLPPAIDYEAAAESSWNKTNSFHPLNEGAITKKSPSRSLQPKKNPLLAELKLWEFYLLWLYLTKEPSMLWNASLCITFYECLNMDPGASKVEISEYAVRIDDIYWALYLPLNPLLGFQEDLVLAGYVTYIWTIFMELGKRIPYNNPIQDKLVRLIKELLHLPPIKVLTWIGEDAPWQNLPTLDDSLMVAWDDLYDPEIQGFNLKGYWVNYFAFLGRLVSADVTPNWWEIPSITLKEVLFESVDPDYLTVYKTMALAEYIKHAGDASSQWFIDDGVLGVNATVFTILWLLKAPIKRDRRKTWRMVDDDAISLD